MELIADKRECNQAVRAAQVMVPGENYAGAVEKVRKTRSAYKAELQRAGRLVPHGL